MDDLTMDGDALPDLGFESELPDLDFIEIAPEENLMEVPPTERPVEDAVVEALEEDDNFMGTQFSTVEEVINAFTRQEENSGYDVNSDFEIPTTSRISVNGTKRTFDLEDDEAEDLDSTSGIDLDEVLSVAIDAGASDIHLTPQDEICFTVLGEIQRRHDFPELNGTRLLRLRQEIISNVLDQSFTNEFELDTSYVLRSGRHKGRRMRLSVGRTFSETFMVFRVINNVIPSPSELGITGHLLEWTKLPNGLVMMNGPTGTGKSTTLASLIREIQLTRAQKIITIEKPVEFLFGKVGKALITQREVGLDSKSFTGALNSAMRQAPDIIVVGEVRTMDEINTLLRAAETGHLAISTMHTNSAPLTINRIQSLFQGDEQARILSSMSDNLRGLANQVLLKSPDGKSRFAAREVLEVTPEISEMILRGDTKAMRQYQIDNEITLEHDLVRAVKDKKATKGAARSQSSYPAFFDELMKSKFS